uniref:Uncharacterized protein n=1 Tax=Glossina austeni TaxID=7395 RepID=A0A1A9VYW6_GLOAU
MATAKAKSKALLAYVLHITLLKSVIMLARNEIQDERLYSECDEIFDILDLSSLPSHHIASCNLTGITLTRQTLKLMYRFCLDNLNARVHQKYFSAKKRRKNFSVERSKILKQINCIRLGVKKKCLIKNIFEANKY